MLGFLVSAAGRIEHKEAKAAKRRRNGMGMACRWVIFLRCVATYLF
jgi:hypothetical protein